MARPKLRSPDQPRWVRFLLGLYEAAASLKLAVVVIAASAVVLGGATVVESAYGPEAVRLAFYGAWWFNILLALLGLNVLCAALIRFPWKKHQVGFLITHAGILVLLAGCLVQRLAGVDANMVVYEGDTSRQVIDRDKHFLLLVASDDAAESGAKPEKIEVPFRSGPFNWDDYQRPLFFPWRLVRRDRGLLYNRNGIELEVLDYYADSKRLNVPRIVLDVDAAPGTPAAVALEYGLPQRVELSVFEDAAHDRFGLRPCGRGERKQTAAGLLVAFWMTRSEAETGAFLHSRPEGPLGPLGQLVLYAANKEFHLPVQSLQQAPQPLGDTGIELKLLQLSRKPWGVHLEIHRKDAPPRMMSLFADYPNASFQDYRGDVYGTYWLVPPDAAPEADPRNPHAGLTPTAGLPRIDILLGHDGKLYYREWAVGQVTGIGPWPHGGQGPAEVADTRLAVFKETRMPLQLRMRDFDAAERPEIRIEPVPFQKKKPKGLRKQPRARIRLAIDGNSRESWVPLGGPAFRDEEAVVRGEDRRVEAILANNVFELGFQLYLHDFKRKMDPGSPMESHFSSLVDVLDLDEPPNPLRENVLITMNEPLTATDPKSGRSYRFYQADFDLAARAGEPEFNRRVYGKVPLRKRAPQKELYYSVLSVNYDPGRGLKYAGSLLIVAGIATMFYMRAYFSRRRGAAADEAAAKPATRPSHTG